MEAMMVLLGLMLVFVIVIAPIWTLVAIYTVRHEQKVHADELKDEVARVARMLEEQRQPQAPGPARATAAAPTPAAPRPAPAPAAAPPAPRAAAAAQPAPPPPPLPRGIPRPFEPVVQPAAPPREPSAFERRAAVLLRQMWSWIAIGAEHRAPGVSYEYAVATNWLLRIGIVILVTGVGFFLKYSIDHGWLGPQGRVAVSIITGVIMLALGIRLTGRRYHLIGQGLMGGGMATLYFSVYAAYAMYHLLSVPVAFGAMILITFSAGFLAVRLDSLLVALLGIIGGYFTPVMIASGSENFIGLFSYLTVLGIGVLGVAYRKRWYLLNYLALLGTYTLYFSALHAHYAPAHFWRVMPFLVVFFAIFSTITFVYCIAKRERATLLELLVLLANTAIIYGSGYHLIAEAYGREWAAVLTLGLTAFYVVHVHLFLLRKLADRALLLAFLALASFFLTMTLPLLLTRQWLTVSWAVQALVMLWLALRLGSNFLAWLALVMYGIVLVRLAGLDFPRAFGAAQLAQLRTLTLGAYLKTTAERLVLFGVPIASLTGAWLLLRRADAEQQERIVSAGNDVGIPAQRRTLGSLLVWLGALVLFYFVHQELHGLLGAFCAPLRLPALTMVWLGLGTAVLLTYRRTMSALALCGLGVICIAVLLKFVVQDVPAWSPVWHGHHYRSSYTAATVALRLLDFAVLIAFFGALARVLGKARRTGAGALALAVALVALWFYLTFETSSALTLWLPRMRAGGVSIVWALYALGLLIAGIQRGARGLRYPGLALFAIVMIKVFFFDLDHLDQLYRIIAFVVLGLLFLSGSLLYLKFQKKLGISNGDATEAA